MSAADHWVREPRRGAPPKPDVPGDTDAVERTLADLDEIEPAPEASVRRPAGWFRGRDTDAVEHADAPRAPIDLDRLQETAWAIVGAVLYLLGVLAAAVTLTVAFAGWVGALVVLVAGAAPSAYSLAKASQRRAERERRAHFAAQQERTSHDMTGIDIPIPR